jgi:citrate lyase subunit beta/citryl-CoA lyase
MIETAVGVENAYLIASACPRVGALTLGGQDLTADMGVQKTKEGWELFYARSRVAVAARAAGVDVYDTVWADISDKEGLLKECKLIVGLGFTGKAAIHPDQIETIHQAFMPDEKELKKALRVVEAAENAKKEGKGVISVDGKMVDAPVVARARHLLELADLYGFERSGS